MRKGIAPSARAVGRNAWWWLLGGEYGAGLRTGYLAAGILERDEGQQHIRLLHGSCSSSSSNTPAPSSPSQLPLPGAPLKKATPHEMVIGGLLRRGNAPKTPPSHHPVFQVPTRDPEESAKRRLALKQMLEKYKKDIMRGKNGRDSSPSPHALPFLEDTITHLVGREQDMLLLNRAHDGSDTRKDMKVSPSRVRAMAMGEALRGDGFYGEFGRAEAGLGEHGRGSAFDWSSPECFVLDGYIRTANAIIGIISAVESRVALTGEEKMAVARAAAEALEEGVEGCSGEAALTGETSKRRHLPTPDDVIDCLQLLDLPRETISRVISVYPNILFLDVDRHMLPVLAYLSDLGLDDADMAEIVSTHPSIFKPSNENSIQSGVAFWMGKGLSRTSIVGLIKLDPAILETNRLVMQMKVDWLTEHTGLTVEQLAIEPRTLSANLGALTAPRIAWLLKMNKARVGEFDSGLLSRIVGSSPDELNRHGEQVDGLGGFLEFFGGDPSEYEIFVNTWYPSEFVPWLERKSRMSEILLQEESDMVELGIHDARGMRDDDSSSAIQAFAAGKEFAWEQQMEREREWHMAWHAWKREQQSLAVSERAVRRHQQRSRDVDGGMVGSASNPETLHTSFGSHGAEQHRPPAGDLPTDGDTTVPFMATKNTNETPRPANGSMKASPPFSLSNSGANHQRSVFFLSRKWTCDATIDEALSQAIADCEQLPGQTQLNQSGPVESFDPESLSNLSVERVQSCAVNLLLLLRASEYGTLEPKVFNAWAARSGVAMPELTAAKAIMSSSGAAFVHSEPSWKYHSVPQKVWRLRDTVFFAPGLLPMRETRGSRAVADLAEVIHKSLKQNPDVPMTRMEISDMYGNKPEFHSKRMRFAIGLLLEQGMVIQRRRRGIASGPMELVLTEHLMKN